MPVLRAGATYFACVFAAGFVLGALRVALLAPCVGAARAELIELPVMVAIVAAVARWRQRATSTFSTRHQGAVGVVALALLLATECAVGFCAQGRTPYDVLFAREPAPGAAYALSLLAFAALPWWWSLPVADRRWPAGVAIAIATLLFVRVRLGFACFAALHRYTDRFDGSVFLVGGAILAVRVGFGRGRVIAGLGLASSVARGAAFGVVAGAPMFAQAWLASRSLHFDADVVRGCVVAPVVEELLFRSAMVGVPVRAGRMPFWPFAIGAASVFGATHLSWGAPLDASAIGVFAATAAGGAWFAWIQREWAWNAWTTIVLHAVMNAAWMVTGAADDAMGGLDANLGRALTIALGTLLTVRHRRAVSAAAS